MLSIIINFFTTMFLGVIDFLENIMEDITLPKWIRIFLVILLASVLIVIIIGLIHLIIGISMALLTIVGVLVAVFFSCCLVYAIIELIRNRF